MRSSFPYTNSDVLQSSSYDATLGNNIYHPRYWGAWVSVAALFVVGRLPRKMIMAIGSMVGRLFYLLNKKRRHYALVNLEICFPHWPVEKRRQVVVDHFRNYGQTFVDLGMLWSLSEETLQKYIQISGISNWYQAIAENQSVIIITPHMTATDMAGTLLSSRSPMCAMMKNMKNPLLNHYVVKGRSRFGLKLFNREQGIRKLVRCLNKKITCLYIPDQDFGENASMFVPFFGTPAATLTTLGRISRMTNAVVLPLFAHLDSETGVYHVTINKPLVNFPTNNAYTDARTMNAVFENVILKAPEQYMWTLRWFKTRPNNEPVPY